MIPRRYIEEWREFAPWPENGQVEQDLIIERTIVELFSDLKIKRKIFYKVS